MQGADVDRVYRLKFMQAEDGLTLPFSIRYDVKRLEDAIQKLGDVKLVMVDPAGHYLEGIDVRDEIAVRQALDPLIELARVTNVAFVLVMHVNKGESLHIKHKILGSVAFGAVARMIWFLSKHPNEGDKKRILSLSKANTLGHIQTGLSYGLKDGRPLWDPEPILLDADSIARLLFLEADRSQPSLRGRPADQSEEASKKLLAELEGGAVKQGAIIRTMGKAGHSESTIRKVIKDLMDQKRIVRFRGETDDKLWLELATDQPRLPGLEEGDDGASA